VTKLVQKSKSPVLQAAMALMEARNVGMVTPEEWKKLAKGRPSPSAGRKLNGAPRQVAN
jgi:hypothetical protein